MAFNLVTISLKMQIFFYFTIALLYVSSEATSSVVTKNEAETLIQHGLNKCLCSNKFLKTPDRISNGDVVERLVVYLYRNKFTNEVFMYTPRKRAQYFYPDLPIEEDDDFVTVTTETVNQIVRTNENFIKVNSLQSESGEESKDITDNDAMAIGLDTGITETTKLRPAPINELLNEDNVKDGSTQSDDFDKIFSIENDNGVEITENGENLIVVPQIDNINNQSITKDYVSTEDVTNLENTDRKCPPDKPFCHIITSIYNNKFRGPSGPVNDIDDTQYTSNIEAGSEKLSANSDKVFDLLKGDEGNYENYPKTKNLQKMLKPLLSLFRKPTSFDGWFDQQIHKLSNNSKQLESSFDLDYLKSKLENILFENQILITKDGDLENSQAGNLRLHHISVGDIGTYKSLQNIESNTLPHPNSWYLDLIVVTQVNPSKLLGVIPLKKRCDESPKTPYRRAMSSWTIHQLNPTERFYHHPYNYYENLPDEFNKYYSLPNLIRPKKNLRQNEQRNKPESSFLSNVLPHDKILSTIKSLIDLRVGPVSLPGDIIDIIGSGNKRNQNLQNQDEVEIDDDIGIRIIGGHPATSSGTPLSNKGRSAAI